jgi:magnesium and cobalt transporter
VSDGWLALLLAAGAVLCVLLYFGLSLGLAAASRLSPFALQRLGNEWNEKLAFVQTLSKPESGHRLAASLARQLTLLGLLLFAGSFAAHSGFGAPWRWTISLAAVGAVVILEHAVARGLAEWNSKAMLRATLWLIRGARFVLLPLVAVLAVWLAWCDGNGRSDEEREEEQDEQVEALIEVGEREGLLEAEESRMMRGIVDLDETVVRELMTPRTEIVALDVTTAVHDARRIFLEAGYSRLPVFRDSIDNIVGLLHSRDLFRAWEAGHEDHGVEDYVRPAQFVPESISAAELLREMRLRSHMAMVVDEYGGVAGLVTLEDLLEEIVGDIRDEHDEEEISMRAEEDGSWVVNADVHVKEIEQLFAIRFEDRDFDTVGGLVVSAFGRVPEVGDRGTAHGLAVEVLEADHKRVGQVRLSPERATGEDAS